jgi:hypothetical protein
VSELNYVYEIGSCSDQEARGRALKDAVEEQWPGSTVELRSHSIGRLIAAARADGAASLRQIAAALDGRGIPAERGGRWSAGQVRRILRSLNEITQRSNTYLN